MAQKVGTFVCRSSTIRNNKLALEAYRCYKTHLGDVISNMNWNTYSWIEQWGATEVTTKMSLITNENMPQYQQKASHSQLKHKRWGGRIKWVPTLKKAWILISSASFSPAPSLRSGHFRRSCRKYQLKITRMDRNNVPDRKPKERRWTDCSVSSHFHFAARP